VPFIRSIDGFKTRFISAPYFGISSSRPKYSQQNNLLSALDYLRKISYDRGVQWPTLFRAGFFLGLALAGLFGSSCARSHEPSVYETPCGSGKLSLRLRLTPQAPAPPRAQFSLIYEASGRSRVVDLLKPRAQLYARPLTGERFSRLRPGPDNWPVFVNPKEFTPAEYDLIRAQLAEKLGEIDAATAKERLTASLDVEDAPTLSSIRYVDYAAFGRSFVGSFPKARVRLEPDGRIWCIYLGGQTVVGSVVENGRRVVISPGDGLKEQAGLNDPVGYVLSCEDERGRKIGDEFEVVKLTNAACELAMKHEREARAQEAERSGQR
jgi:hypothetical protein